MSGSLIAVVGVLYALAALDAALRGNWAMTLVLAGYTVANVGLLLLGARP